MDYRGQLIDSVLEVKNHLFSENGYPIYDLMIANPHDLTGYPKISSVIFYTENDVVLNEFLNIHKNQDLYSIKEFLKHNPQCVNKVSEFKKVGLKEMSYPMYMAFKNLLTVEKVNHTYQHNSYGIANLMINNEILIFNHTTSTPIQQLLSKLATQKSATIKEKYAFLQEGLSILFTKNLIQPETKIIGKAFNKVMPLLAQLKNYTFNHHQEETIRLVTDLAKFIVPYFDMRVIEKTPGNYYIDFLYESKKIEVSLPREKDAAFEFITEKETRPMKDIVNLLYFFNQYLYDVKVAHDNLHVTKGLKNN